MTTPTPQCPDCQGEQFTDHPGGWLIFDHGNSCGIRAREDSRKLADDDAIRSGSPLPTDRAAHGVYLAASRIRGVWLPFIRPATATEHELLAAVGIARVDGGPVESELWTCSTHVAGRVVRRIWPELILSEREDNTE